MKLIKRVLGIAAVLPASPALAHITEQTHAHPHLVEMTVAQAALVVAMVAGSAALFFVGRRSMAVSRLARKRDRK